MHTADDYFAFHLFAARFPNQAEAELFTFEQWEPEPAADACAAEFSAWEARNPSWRLKQELGYYMDSDFVELIDREDGPQYLESLVRSDTGKQQLRMCIDPGYSHYILIGSDSIHGERQSDAPGPHRRQPTSTATLDYLGEFNVAPD